MVDYELLIKLFPPTLDECLRAFTTLLIFIAILIVSALIIEVLEERFLANRTWIALKERRWLWDLTISETYQLIKALLVHSENKN